jgi:HK97 family phage major capsid protein
MIENNEIYNAVKSAIVESASTEITSIKSELETIKTNYNGLEKRIEDSVKSKIEVKNFDVKGTPEDYKSALSLVITNGLKNFRNVDNYIKSMEADNGDNFVKRFAYEFAQKNLSSTTLQDGGILIQPTMYSEILPYLFEKGLMDVIRRKANVVDMPAGTLNIPKDTQEPTEPTFYAPNTQATLSTVSKFDLLTLVKKDLKYNILFDNELIDNAGYNTVQYVQRKAETTVSLYRDEQILYGTGASQTLKGLVNQYTSSNDFAIAGATLSNVRADLIKAKSKVDTALRQNIDLTRCVFVMPARTRYAIEALATTDGYMSELSQELINRNTLVGVEVITSNLVPTNLGGGSDTEIMLIDMSKVFFGVYKPLTMEFTRNDVYYNNSGVTQYGKDTDQSILRIRESFDLLMSYNAGMVKITGVTY